MTMALVSCKKPDIEEKVLKLYAPSSFIFEESGGNETIYIHSSDAWSVTSDQPWCILSPASGPAGDGTFTIKVDSNNSTDIRQANVKITSGSLSESITVTQKKEHKVNELKLLTPSNITFDEKGSYQTVYFRSSEDWSVESDQQWCNVSPESGTSGDASITVIVKDNDTYDQRNARLTIRTATMSESLTVTQKQMDAMLISSNKVEMSSEANHFDITIKSNISFEYEILGPAKDWISVSVTRALTEQTIGFNVIKNDSEDNRQGSILFKGSSGQVELVEVYQEGCVSVPDEDPEPEIVLTQNKYIVVSEGEEIKIEIKSNTDYELIMPSVDWLTEIATRSQSTYTHYVAVSPNTTYSSRSAHIMVRATTGSRVELIEIVQVQNNAIVLAQEEYKLNSDEFLLEFDVLSNVEFDVSVSVDWITKVLDTRSLQRYPLSFQISANTSDVERIGYISLTSDTLEQKIKVVQDGKSSVVTSDPYVTITHVRSSFTTPEFWGLDFWGTIYWGDGVSTIYKPDLMHMYSSEDEHHVKIEMTGADGFKITNLKGIKHIDLSNFK
jgi:hypothetical protein